MKFSILILFVLSIISCEGQEFTPSIQIDNSEVFFVKKDNSEIYSYSNNLEKSNSYNLISFTITNPTNKKLIFLFDKSELFPSSNIYLAKGTLSFTINNKNEVLSVTSPLTTFTKDSPEGLMETFFYNDSLTRVKYSVLGIPNDDILLVDNYVKNSFILYPKESRTFKFSINLPIVREISSLRGHNPLSYQNLREGQTFKLFYSCNAAALKKILPQYLIEELNRNNTEIFSGIIESNNIPLKLRK